MFATPPATPACIDVDVALPLGEPLAVDLDLSTAAARPSVLPHALRPAFQPSLSQVAADPSRLRLRWPVGSRPGYDGQSGGNWMRDSRVGFRGRTVGGA